MPEDVFENARYVLAQLMDERGVKQVELAAVLKMPQPRISERLSGRSRLTLAEVDRAARYFKVPHNVFFEGLTPVAGSRPRGNPAADRETAKAA